MTTYLTVPARLVRCPARTLWLLLSDLDATYWMLGDTEITTAALIHAPVGCSLTGSDSSDVCVVEGVWVNSRFADEIRAQATEVILGERPRIELTLLRGERDREIQRRKIKHSTTDFAMAWDFDIFPQPTPSRHSSGTSQAKLTAVTALERVAPDTAHAALRAAVPSAYVGPVALSSLR